MPSTFESPGRSGGASLASKTTVAPRFSRSVSDAARNPDQTVPGAPQGARPDIRDQDPRRMSQVVAVDQDTHGRRLQTEGLKAEGLEQRPHRKHKTLAFRVEGKGFMVGTLRKWRGQDSKYRCLSGGKRTFWLFLGTHGGFRRPHHTLRSARTEIGTQHHHHPAKRLLHRV